MSHARKTIIVNQSLATSNSFTYSLLGKLNFQPKKMIIRQILYCNIAGADLGTYLLSSNLTQDNIAAVYVGIQGNSHNPESEIDITNDTHQIQFTLTPANAAFTGPTGQLTLTIEFVA